MARAPYQPIEAEPLRPVATPIDTFVQAQTPSRDTALQDLARSLSGLGGSLGEYVGARDKKAEEEDKARGEAAFWRSNGAGSAEAVSKGLIPAQASPAFMSAYKRLEGEIAGGQVEQKLAAAYDAWDGKTSADPHAYDAFVGQFIKDAIKTDDPDILRGLLPKVRQVAANYLQRHIGDTSRAAMTGATTALAAKQDHTIEEAAAAGLGAKTGTDYAGTFGRLEAIRGDGLKVGMNEEEVDKRLIDTVTAKSISLRDPKLLDFLERKVPGKDYTWAATPYGRDQKQKTIDTLEAMGRRSIADDEKKRREDKATLKDDVTRRTIQAITAHPNEPVPEDLLARGEKVDPDFRVNAITWRDKIAKGQQTSDPEELYRVTADILNGGGLQVVQRAMARGAFKNAEDLTKAWKLAESMTAEGPKLGDMLKGGSAKTVLDTIRQRTLTKGSLDAAFDPGGTSNEGLQAQADFKLQLLAWRQAHPEANLIEQEKAIADIGAGILKRITSPGLEPGGYERGGIEGANTYGSKEPLPPAPEPEAAPQAKQPQGPRYGAPEVQVPSGLPGASDAVPSPSPAAPPPRPPASAEAATDATDWFNRQPPEVRQALEQRAAAEKKPLSLKVREVFDRGVAAGVIKAIPRSEDAPAPAAPGKQSMVAPDGTPIETASATAGDISKAFDQAIDAPAPAERVRMLGEAFERAIASTSKPAGGYSAAQLRDDPKAARILDFVAGPESGGNYNAFFGNAGSTKDLSAMSLDQVMQWSRTRGTASSATGRYQFMAATLRGLKTDMGLSGAERFTPELQDRLALRLLERRGYAAWQAGRMSTAQFANNLALEWASLPNITAQNNRPAGVSAYAGDGLNKSSVSPGSVLAALSGAAGGSIKPAGLLSRLTAAVTGRTAGGTVPAGNAPGGLALGDSLAHGVRAAGRLGGDTQEGISSAEVLRRVEAIPAGQLKGRSVVLSSGISNSPRDVESVRKQLAYLQAAGARVVLLGTGPKIGADTLLQTLAARYGASFQPIGETGKDGVHPKDYRALYGRIRGGDGGQAV